MENLKDHLPGFLTRGEQVHTGRIGGHQEPQMRTLNAVSPMGEAGVGGKPMGQGHGILAKPQPGEASEGAVPLFTPSTGDGVRDYSASESTGDAPPSAAMDKGPTTYIGVSDAQGRRNYMEDRHTVIPSFDVGARDGIPRQFVAVYDGHSSHRGSEHASRRLHEFIVAQHAVKECQGEPRSREESDAMEEALKGAFQKVDDEIVTKAVQGGKRYGTTAVCALRVGRVVYVAHAGDSRAVLCRDGHAVSLTKDHKPTVPEEAARIESQGKKKWLVAFCFVLVVWPRSPWGVIDYGADRVHSNPEGMRQSRLNMSRQALAVWALGDPDFKGPRELVVAEPDVARVVLKPGRDTFYVLGSDGLFDVMTNQEAVDFVNSFLLPGVTGGGPTDQTAEMAAQALVEHALKLKTNDNVTALVVLVAWD
ncbi:hypothetical protein N2152v2_002698 [Parachlorella kessleri]